MLKEDQTAFSKRIAKQQANKGYLKFPNKPQQQKYKTSLKKLTYKPKTGILRAKWLKELKLEEEHKIITKFAKKNRGKYYKTAAK